MALDEQSCNQKGDRIMTDIIHFSLDPNHASCRKVKMEVWWALDSCRRTGFWPAHRVNTTSIEKCMQHAWVRKLHKG